MPWKETRPMDERLQFVSACVADEETMACLCRQFGIFRKTGYKWLRRYESEGAAGLAERSRAPRSHPNAVSAVALDIPPPLEYLSHELLIGGFEPVTSPHFLGTLEQFSALF